MISAYLLDWVFCLFSEILKVLMWKILLFLAPVPPNDNCCQKITLSSQGGVQVHYSEALGDYVVESTDDNGKPIFRHKTNLISVYLHHTR